MNYKHHKNSTLYNKGAVLYLEASKYKSDDIELIEAHITKRYSRVADLCGGYGRLRVNISNSNVKWYLFELSPVMVKAARHNLRDIRSSFVIKGDVLKSLGNYRSYFGLAVMAHNSINEIHDIKALFKQVSACLRIGGLLYIKSIVLPKGEHESRSTNMFHDRLGEEYYVEYLSYTAKTHPNRQVMKVTFTQNNGFTIVNHFINRYIWQTSYLNREAKRAGMTLSSTSSNNEHLVYKKLY